MTKISKYGASQIVKADMPKEMSEYLERRILDGEYSTVTSGGKTGYVIKTRDCTITFFPNWNCDGQFKDIVNTFRKKSTNNSYGEQLYY